MIIFEYYKHITLALFLGFGLDLLLLRFTIIEGIFYYVFIILGSLLPDIDHPKSFIGRRIRPFSDIINKSFGHRTATHSILIITVLFFITVLLWEMNTIVVGLMLGAMLHILGDLLTPEGVEIAYPLSKKRYKLIK